MILLSLCFRYSEADTLYNQTKTLADKARERAKEAYKVALKLYTEATSIKLPAFNLDLLDSNTDRIKKSVRKKQGEGGGGLVLNSSVKLFSVIDFCFGPRPSFEMGKVLLTH